MQTTMVPCTENLIETAERDLDFDPPPLQGCGEGGWALPHQGQQPAQMRVLVVTKSPLRSDRSRPAVSYRLCVAFHRGGSVAQLIPRHRW